MTDPNLGAGKPFRILVADDSSEIREMLVEALSSIDCIVICAADGLEALSRLELGAYDLVITDFHMPRLDGMALLRRVKTITPSLPAILITGWITADVTEEAKRAGAILVVSKPFSIPHILSLVERIRDRRPADQCRSNQLRLNGKARESDGS